MNTNNLSNHAIGIDIGSSRVVIAVVKKGGVDIISNEATYRSTPTIISYGKERQMGDSAKSKINKNIKNSIFFPTRYLGRKSPSQFAIEKKFNFSKSSLKNGKVYFNIQYEDKKIDLSSEQVTAALFTKIKQILALNKIAANDCVVSVPSYFKSCERQAMIDSANIAGIKILRVYNESTANVMNYGIFRKSDLKSDDPRLVGFVDFGYGKTSFFLANMWKDRAEIIYECNDRNLGVRDLDRNMMEYYCNVFYEKNKMDLRENPKSVYRLGAGLEKQRKVLTGNSVSPISIEFLFEDFDFFENIKRDDWENINESVFRRFEDLMKKAKSEILGMKIDLKKLHSIERIGNGCRIPKIVQIVQENFGIKNISKTLDASESISRGCAIQSAMLSTRYSVQKYKITERSHYPIDICLKYSSEDKVTKKRLFKLGSNYEKVLSISIKKQDGLNLELVEGLEGGEEKLLTCQITKMHSKEEKFEGKVSIELNKNGLVNIKSVELIEKKTVIEKIPKKKKEQKKKEKKDKKDKKKEDDKKMEIEEEEFTEKKKEVSTISPLKHNTQFLYGLSESEIKNKSDVENQMRFKEQLIKDTQAAKYLMESYIYDTKTKITDNKNTIFSTNPEKTLMISELNKAENWLYEEGMNCDKKTYEDYLKKLQGTCLCFYSRLLKFNNMRDFLKEAEPAFLGFEENNKEMLALANDLQKDEILKRKNNSLLLIKEMNKLANNFAIQKIDAYEYDKIRKEINDNYEVMNNTVKDIKKEKDLKDKKEREEKEKKEKEEREQKEKEEKEKKEKEDLEKKGKEGEEVKEGVKEEGMVIEEEEKK